MRTSKNFLFLLTMTFVSIMVSGGCMKPYDVPEFERIESNETAFVIPVTGASKENQGKFNSAEFLNELKVGTKRIQIPHTWIQTGRMYNSGEWVDTVRVLKVNRSPVSREWTVDSSSGTRDRDEGIYVESRDSIGFYVGVAITAAVEETDTALYLYRFPSGKLLDDVIDENIRSFVQTELSAEFGGLPLEDKLNSEDEVTQKGCKTAKTEVFKQAAERIRNHFKTTFGITISNLGLIGGLTYDDKEIQEGINNAYLEEMGIKQAENARLKQEKINETNLSIEVTNRLRAEEFSLALEAHAAKTELDIKRMNAEANLERAKGFRERWKGLLPSNMMPANSQFLFNLDTQR